MKSYLFIIVICICSLQMVFSQEDDGLVAFDLPLRNSLVFNRFSVNPTFTFVRQQNRYFSINNKREWVQFENAPETYLASYSGRFAENMGAGIAVFQQNYGVLTTFGGLLNFAYNIKLNTDSNLTFGLNVGAYKSGINTSNVVTNIEDPSIQNIPSNFLLTVNPGINYGTEFLDFGISVNNLVLYNFESSAMVKDNPKQGIQAHVMHTGYFNGRGFFNKTKFSALLKSDFRKDETIISGLAMLNVPKGIWLQAGYNNVYGVSGGLGINLTPQIALEYNVEKAIGELVEFGPSHDITLAYRFIVKKDFKYSGKDKVSGLFSKKRPKKPVTALSKAELEGIRERAAERRIQAKLDKDSEKNNIIEAEEKANRIAAAKALAEAQIVKAAADAKLLAEQHANEEAEAQAKIEADRKAKEIAAANALAEAQIVKAAADAKLLAEQQANEEAEAKAKIEVDRKAKEIAAANALAEAQIVKVEANRQAQLAAKQMAKEKAEADTKLLAKQQAKLEAESQAKIEADRKIKGAADAKALANAKVIAKQRAQLLSEQKAKLAEDTEAQQKAKEELITIPKDELAQSMLTLTEKTEETKTTQKALLKQFDNIVEIKDKDLEDLKEENDLSDQGITVQPKPFKSLTAENNALNTIKTNLDDVIKSRNEEIEELKTLYEQRTRFKDTELDEINIFYKNKIKRLSEEQIQAVQTKTQLDVKLETIRVATEIEKRRRIKRAAFDNQDDRYARDRAMLKNIKRTTQFSSTPFKTEDFDFGEEQGDNIQILKNVNNVESGYYLIIAVHSNINKRNDFVTKVVASGRNNVDYFYDISSSKYYIYYEKFDGINRANEAMKAKGNRSYNIKMSLVKIEN